MMGILLAGTAALPPAKWRGCMQGLDPYECRCKCSVDSSVHAEGSGWIGTQSK